MIHTQLMARRCVFSRLAICTGLLFPLSAVAQPLNVNLVVNGDAETGTIDGWVDGGIEVEPSGPAGVLGLEPGVSIGDFCFTGDEGLAAETLSQSVDVSALASRIDAGELRAVFGVLLQARQVSGAFDTASARLEYLDGTGGLLEFINFTDPGVPLNVFDWDSFRDERTVPAGTRELRVELRCTRNAGVSSDGFIDNVSVVLSGTCYADCDGGGGLDIFDFICFQDAFAQGDPYADCTGNGTLDIFDFLCFQDAFVMGCP